MEDIMTNLDRLNAKHRKLDLEIAHLQSRKILNDEERSQLHLLKKRKLALRDEIADLAKKEHVMFAL
jgi:uncharacterized protein YdcH (DUF465 family)